MVKRPLLLSVGEVVFLYHRSLNTLLHPPAGLAERFKKL